MKSKRMTSFQEQSIDIMSNTALDEKPFIFINEERVIQSGSPIMRAQLAFALLSKIDDHTKVVLSALMMNEMKETLKEL